AVGLDDNQPRRLRNQPGRDELLEGLAERRHVAEISARDDDSVRDFPRELLEELDHRRLLALEPEWIQRIEEVFAGRRTRGEALERRVEVTVDFDDLGAEIERL